MVKTAFFAAFTALTMAVSAGAAGAGSTDTAQSAHLIPKALRWTKVCPAATEASQAIPCFVTKPLYTPAGTLMMDVLLMPQGVDARGSLGIAIQTAVTVQVAHGLRLAVDSSRPVHAAYDTCGKFEGCSAVVILDATAMSALKAGHYLTVQAIGWDGGMLSMSVPLDGLAKALEGPGVDLTTQKAERERFAAELAELFRQDAASSRPKAGK